MTDEQHIRDLIERWAAAVQTATCQPCSPTTRATS